MFKLRGTTDGELDQMEEELTRRWIEEAEAEERERIPAAQAMAHQNLRRFRVKRGFKKKQMAEMMGVSERSYYDFERGRRPIPSDALISLHVRTSADLNEILLGTSAHNYVSDEPHLVRIIVLQNRISIQDKTLSGKIVKQLARELDKLYPWPETIDEDKIFQSIEGHYSDSNDAWLEENVCAPRTT